MAGYAVTVERVSRLYQRGGFEITALHEIDLRIGHGEFVGIMGPSGSGKTTLLNLIAGMDRPTSGRIVIGDSDITHLGEGALARWRARHVGIVFQFYNLIPVLTAFENVELPLLLTSLGKAERRRRVETVLSLVGLADRQDHYPRQLSGGQEQRVAIARALVADPTLIIADEPTGDLDARAAEDILGLLAELNQQRGKTIVIVTHDARSEAYVDRIVVLDKGELGIPRRPEGPEPRLGVARVEPAAAAAGRPS
jgi:putative ABC transport system ATP-binding protein